MKHSMTIVLMICFCFPCAARERRKPIPMEKLTTPGTHHYVPHPYPKTRKEILSNLSYFFKKKRLGTTQVGEIFKVKNRISNYSKDYVWLILLTDEMRTVLRANGHHGGSERRCDFGEMIKTKKDALCTLSQALGKAITEKDIKYAELTSFLSPIARPTNPIWEIELLEGKRYYCASNTGYVYQVERKQPWTMGRHPSMNYAWEVRKQIHPYSDFLIDTIDDEIIVLKALNR